MFSLLFVFKFKLSKELWFKQILLFCRDFFDLWKIFFSMYAGLLYWGGLILNYSNDMSFRLKTILFFGLFTWLSSSACCFIFSRLLLFFILYFYTSFKNNRDRFGLVIPFRAELTLLISSCLRISSLSSFLLSQF